MAREMAVSQALLSEDPVATSGVYAKTLTGGGGWGLVRVTERERLSPVPLADGAVLGSGSGASAVVADGEVKSVHGRFTVRADGPYVEAHDQDARIWVDGVRAERMALAHGSVVRMGNLLGIFVERDLSRYCGRLGRVGGLVFGPRQKSWVDAAVAHVRSRESFLIEGAPGTGKASLALAALSTAGSGRSPVVVDARTATAKVSVCDALVSKPPSMVVLHLEQLDRAAQIEMVRLLKRSPGTVLAATLGRTLAVALSDGLLAPAVVSLMNGRRVRVPALEERREDIAPIVSALCEREGLPTSIITPSLLESLVRGGWKEGFREIHELLLEIASPSMTDEERLARVRDQSSRPAIRTPLALQQEDPDLARARLQRALDRAGGTIAAAARELRVSRQAFYREIKRLDVELPRKRLREAVSA
jgi:hypothetical protein